MGVYLDTAANGFGRMVMCHMIADTPSELHEMALAIGMQRKWYQTPDGPGKVSFPHYDVSKSRKVIAIQRGALVLERRPFVERKRLIRARILEDAVFARSWSYHV